MPLPALPAAGSMLTPTHIRPLAARPAFPLRNAPVTRRARAVGVSAASSTPTPGEQAAAAVREFATKHKLKQR